MKLYTEEQVIDMVWKFASLVGRTAILVELNSLTPIELPSDEEIEEKSNKRWWKGATPPSSFTEGAKWVIEHIKQQDNGQ